MLLTKLLLCFLTLEALSVAIFSSAMGDPKEIEIRNIGFYPTILGELLYLMNRYVFASTKKKKMVLVIFVVYLVSKDLPG